jgi:hypothetical protein
MTAQPGRPRKQRTLDDYLEVRVETVEKQAFRDAADFAGLPLPQWIRERLRRTAIRELEAAGIEIAFLIPRRSE